MRTALSFAGARPTPLGQLGTVSGRTRRQLRVKVFRGRDGLTNASIKVRGDRAHIARFGEEGTKRQPARKMFETVGRLLRTTIEQQFVAAFERNMKAKGYK
jgi:hypothetical protein